LKKKEGNEEMKGWVELENLTLEKVQKFNKTYDSSYSDYMCEIRVPKANGKIPLINTTILGNYGLYYKRLDTTDSYSCVATLITEKITNKQYLMSCAYGTDSGASDFKNRAIKIADNVFNVSQISINADLPEGTTIRVWGR
jgi:hypothetical protein